jgi:hypothetical protein
MKIGKWRYNSTTLLTLALDEGEWSGSHPSHFTPWETAAGTHCTGGWVGPRASLDVILSEFFIYNIISQNSLNVREYDDISANHTYHTTTSCVRANYLQHNFYLNTGLIFVLCRL